VSDRLDPSRFEARYAQTPAWDIGRPQPAFLGLIIFGMLVGTPLLFIVAC